MTKRALLIGINYPGTSVELRGCVNDALRMQKCLIDRYGFSNGNITLLIDTDKSGTQPTGKNIRKALIKLIDSGESGDVLVFHYSGHGTRLPPEKGIVGDLTGFDECITPCDMNLIMDHEFREMAAKVKDGCKLTIISDSCHSGGLLEDVKEQIGESHIKQPKVGITTYFLSIMMSLLATCGITTSQKDPENFTKVIELDNGETADMKSRFLPLASFVTLLEQQTGQTGIDLGKIRRTLISVFGDDSSPKVLLNSMKRNGDRGYFSTLLDKLEINGATNKIADKGILLSGCQTDQRSEDVYVVRTGKSYGAFSDSIQKILLDMGKEDKITNRKMVMESRKILIKQGFSQRPGLYCHDRYVDKPFIC